MAKDKKSFILYNDQAEVINNLPDAKAGKLLKMIFAYVNDQNPTTEDLLLKIAFEPIKQQLKRDLKDWEAERSKRSDAGRKGGINSGKSRRSEAKRSSASKNEANEADNVNVTVTVNDTVTVTERDNRPLAKSNLYRQPVIPSKDDVLQFFLGAGGNEEMAEKFYNKHDGKNWFYDGSPITNFRPLASNYISNWKNNAKNEITKRNFKPTGKYQPTGNGGY